MEAFEGPGGQRLFVDPSDGKRGSKGPFYVVFTDPDGTSRWGYYCSNCQTTNNTVDTMGRVHCNDCSNRTKAEEWDAAHE